jgi:hypothetical protein
MRKDVDILLFKNHAREREKIFGRVVAGKFVGCQIELLIFFPSNRLFSSTLFTYCTGK